MMHSTPLGYAKTLGYISDPSTIRRRVLDWFDRAPSVEKCAAIRAKYLAVHAPDRDVDSVVLSKLRWRCAHEKTAENITVMESGQQVCRTCREEMLAIRQASRKPRHNESRLAEQKAKLAALGLSGDLSPGRTLKAVIRNAAQGFGVEIEQMVGKDRSPFIVRPRFAASLVLYELGHSFNTIGRALGGRDHSTVRHGVNRARDIAASDPSYSAAIDALHRAVAA